MDKILKFILKILWVLFPAGKITGDTMPIKGGEKEGLLYLNEDQGFFCSLEQGGKEGERIKPYKHVRVASVFKTSGKKSPPRLKYNRRPVTKYDMSTRSEKKALGSVTSHVDIKPEDIPYVIEILQKMYSKITGKDLTPEEIVEKVKVKDKTEEMLRSLT